MAAASFPPPLGPANDEKWRNPHLGRGDSDARLYLGRNRNAGADVLDKRVPDLLTVSTGDGALLAQQQGQILRLVASYHYPHHWAGALLLDPGGQHHRKIHGGCLGDGGLHYRLDRILPLYSPSLPQDRAGAAPF